MADHDCYDCSRGERWNAGGRAAKLRELEELDRQKRELESRIRSIDTLISNGDREVAAHAASCPEARR